MPDKKNIVEPVTLETMEDDCSESSRDTMDCTEIAMVSTGLKLDQGDYCESNKRVVTPTGKKKKKKKHPLDTVVIVSDTEEDILTYTSTELGITFKIGETVYVQSKKGDQPSSVCTIQGFQINAKNHLLVHVKFYYRATEVPDSVYLSLLQDRNVETKTGLNLAIKDPVIRTRELFRSEVTDTYPVGVLRGKCRVVHYEDIHKVEEFKAIPDTFFYIFEYSPTTKRLATIQGEIRVGPSHQAKLPECQPNKKPADMVERPEDWEDLTWKPTAVLDGDLVMYLRAARSMAAFAGMCDGGSTEDAFTAASMDETTIKALDELHSSGYDTKRALGDLVKRINPKSYEKRWSEEDVKKFVKGLRMYGKNFFKIRKELVPNKETGELVEYYYYWKKTPAATTSRPHTRRRRGRKQTRTPTRQTSEECDASSASELSEGEESEYSDTSSSRDISGGGYFCRNCYTRKSKDWHKSGDNNRLLCTECHVYYEQNDEDRPVAKHKEQPHFLFKPVKDKRDLESPEGDERKSPSSDSVSSLSSSDNRSVGKLTNKQKREGDLDDPCKVLKRSKPNERSESPSESYISDSSSVFNDNEENGNEGDVETNQDDATSTESSSPNEEVHQKQPSQAPSYLNLLRPIPKPAQPGAHVPTQPAHVQPLLGSQQGQNSHFQPTLLKSPPPSLLQSLHASKSQGARGIPSVSQSGLTHPLPPSGQNQSIPHQAGHHQQSSHQQHKLQHPGQLQQPGHLKPVSLQSGIKPQNHPHSDHIPSSTAGGVPSHSQQQQHHGGARPNHITAQGGQPLHPHSTSQLRTSLPLSQSSPHQRQGAIQTSSGQPVHQQHSIARPGYTQPLQKTHHLNSSNSERISHGPIPSDAGGIGTKSLLHPGNSGFGHPQPGVFAPSVQHHSDIQSRNTEIKSEIKSEVQSEGTEDSESSSEKSSESEQSNDRETSSRDSGSSSSDRHELTAVANRTSNYQSLEGSRDSQGSKTGTSNISQAIKQEPVDTYSEVPGSGGYGQPPPPSHHLSALSGTGYPGLLHHGIKEEPKDGASQHANVIQQNSSSQDSSNKRDHHHHHHPSMQTSSSSSSSVTQKAISNTSQGEGSNSMQQQVPVHHRHSLPPHHHPHHMPPHIPPHSLSKMPPHSVHLQIPQVPHPSMRPHPSSAAPVSLSPSTSSSSSSSSSSLISRPPLTSQNSSGSSTSLPHPPPLVSLPQNSIPTTQPPSLIPSHMGGPVPPSQVSLPSTTHPRMQPPPHHMLSSSGAGSGIKQDMLNRSMEERPRSAPRPRSPHTGQGGSPRRERSRSRSPLIRPESDSDSEPPRSPEPEAFIVDKQCHKSKNAIFIKHLSRGWNSCSRCDFEFRPIPDSKLAKKREELRLRRRSSSTSTIAPNPGLRDDRKEHLKEEERMAKKPETPPDNVTADAQITSAVMHSPHIGSHSHSHSHGHGHGHYNRLAVSPRPAYHLALPGDRTPALNQLSAYARHNLAGPGLDHLRGLPPPSLHPHHLDQYRMSMYPPGSREHLELELEREKRERDARERELRERELRELEIREKIKHEIEMKPPGFERLLPPGANPVDPYWAEIMKRYAVPHGGVPGFHQPLPGVYPPVSLANDLMHRERERLERHGVPAGSLGDQVIAERLAAERIQAERLALGGCEPLLRLPTSAAAGGPPPPHPPGGPQHTHTHAHTHLHLHQQEQNLLSGHLPPDHMPGPGGLPAAGPTLPSVHSLPPGHPLVEAAAARQSELLYRDLLSRPPYSTDPVLAHHQLATAQAAQAAAVQQEAIQRQIFERERLGGPHGPPHLR